jgi:hypothetical protein
MLFAQTTPDFSALASILSNLGSMVSSTRFWLREGGPEMWLAMGGTTLFAFWLWRHRPQW